jgi:ankyrin repeat protein
VPHQTALHGAAQRGLTYVVEFLAAHGADLNAADANGRTALQLALAGQEPQVETAEALEKLIAGSATAAL